MRLPLATFAIVLIHLFAGPALGESSCSATNDNEDTCSVSCPTGQTATCNNGTGSNAPSCKCEGTPAPDSKVFLFDGAGTMAASTSRQILETDVLGEVNTRLGTLMDYHISNSCRQVEDGQTCIPTKMDCPVSTLEPMNAGELRMLSGCPDDCFKTFREVCVPVKGKLQSAGNFIVEKSAIVQTKEPNWEDVPTSFFGLRAYYRNCNSKEQEFSFNHDMKLSNGAKVVKTKLIKTGQDLTANVGFEYKEVKLGLATKFSREVSITDSKEENHQEERFYPYRETVRIPEMSLVVYSHEWAEKVVVVPYSGTVQIDGPVKPNKHGIKLLSEVLPTPVDRTFEFSGAVEDAQVFSGISLNDSRKLSKEECKKVAPPKLYEPFVRQTGKYPDESKGVAQ